MFYCKKSQILLDVLVIISVLLVVRCDEEVKDEEANTYQEIGKCECALFNYNNASSEVDAKEKPLMIANPVDIPCPARDDTCKTVCLTYYDIVKETGPIYLCAEVGEVENLMVSLYSRACNNEKWEYVGINNNGMPICCYQGQLVICTPFENNNNDNNDVASSY